MIIDQPFNLVDTIGKLEAELSDYRVAYSRALNLYIKIKEFLEGKSNEFEVTDISISYNTLYASIHLTEEGIFNSIDDIVKNVSTILGEEPNITDNQYAKGKYIIWPAKYNEELRASFSITLYGNSKCKLIVTETRTKVVNEYRVECGELNSIKAITHVQNDNAIGSDNGRLGSGEDLLNQ